MSSLSERSPRARVLRGRAAGSVELAPFGSELVPGSALAAVDPAIVEAASEEGRREGYAQGLAEGRAAAGDMLREQSLSVERVLAALEAAGADLARRQAVEIAAIESHLVEAAFEIARAIVARELEVAADPGRDALVRALALVPSATAAVARLHPADLELLDARDLVSGREIQLVADPSVERGGCVVEAGDASVDAQVGPALERVRRALFGEGELA